MAVEKLDVEQLVASAQLVSGVTGPMEHGLARRFRTWIAGLNDNGRMSPAQAFGARQQIVRLLSTRLRLAADRIRLPAIAQERIERPIFVIGFARTGTTLLHSLVAEDPQARAPQWWQTHEPSPPPGEMPVTAFRMEQADLEMQRMMHEVPGVLQLHPYWDHKSHALIEDEQIYTLDFCNSYPTLVYRVPVQYSGTIAPETVSQAYRFHKEFLQHMQWRLPSRRWVLKGVRHQINLSALFETYPDAICLWPHREPSQVLATFLGISSLWSDAITGGKVDWKQFGASFLRTMRSNVDRILSDPLLNDPRVMHLRFEDLTRDPVGVVRQAYSRFGLPCSDEFEARMQRWLQSNRSDRYGRHAITLEPFGLDAHQVKDLFADYAARFELA